MRRVSEATTPIDTEQTAEYARLIGQRFVQRSDLYAVQYKDGRYICVRRPLTLPILQRHLEGKLTLGTYILNKESRTRCLVLDADTDDTWKHLVEAATHLRTQKIPVYIETSRRGGHLWFFFEKPMDAITVRSFAKGIVQEYGIENIEIYPKQDRLEHGPGSLIRLPFGVHQVVGKRFGFIDEAGKPLAHTARQQIDILARAQTVSETIFGRFMPTKIVRESTCREIVVYEANEALSTRLKRTVTVLEFVSQYVDLSPRGIGKCPFHDDRNPSFGVDDTRNYWHCFAGCGGGSIIDFWMQWQRCDFTTAVTELAHMLL